MSRSSSDLALRRTPLHERHITHEAHMVDFAGWELPVRYSDVRAEHMAVRNDSGAFDVSHMGQLQAVGSEAVGLLQRGLPNDISTIPVGGAQYNLICREDGGVLDDVFTYRLAADRFLVVVNAANRERDFKWLSDLAQGFDVELTDRSDEFAMIAVQGPRARAAVTRLADGELPARMTVAEVRLLGVPAVVAGTGYTGEDGVEILCCPNEAPRIWEALLHAGVSPVGLGARDTLRLEVCFHLYGNDLTEARGPIEGGLGWCCKEDTGFIGADAVRATRDRGPAERLVAFVIEEPGIARAGNQIVGGGEVPSGSLSPCLDAGIGLAYVPASQATVGERLEIDVRGRIRTATVQAKPLVPKRG